MKLHYKQYGEQGPALIILHGLFGSLDNWHTLATQFGEHFRVYTLDQRNHGKSPHSETFSFKAMSDDLLEFMNDQEISTAHLIGHSMGGKTAMRFALDYTKRTDKLIVADMAPKAYNAQHDNVFKALFAVEPDQLSSRKEAEDNMMLHEPDFTVRQFLLKNLARNEQGQYRWKVNLPVIHREYEQLLQEITAEAPFDQPTLFIRGGNSPYIREEDMTGIRRLFPQAQLKTIAGSGHWVHAEAPEVFREMAESFLTA